MIISWVLIAIGAIAAAAGLGIISALLAERATKPEDGMQFLPDWKGKSVFKKEWSIKDRRIKVEMRSKYGVWGRFGGGWDWCFGIQHAKSTTIINLLVMSIRIDRVTER